MLAGCYNVLLYRLSIALPTTIILYLAGILNRVKVLIVPSRHCLQAIARSSCGASFLLEIVIGKSESLIFELLFLLGSILSSRKLTHGNFLLLDIIIMLVLLVFDCRVLVRLGDALGLREIAGFTMFGRVLREAIAYNAHAVVTRVSGTLFISKLQKTISVDRGISQVIGRWGFHVYLLMQRPGILAVCLLFTEAFLLLHLSDAFTRLHSLILLHYGSLVHLLEPYECTRSIS